MEQSIGSKSEILDSEEDIYDIKPSSHKFEKKKSENINAHITPNSNANTSKKEAPKYTSNSFRDLADIKDNQNKLPNLNLSDKSLAELMSSTEKEMNKPQSPIFVHHNPNPYLDPDEDDNTYQYEQTSTSVNQENTHLDSLKTDPKTIFLIKDSISQNTRISANDFIILENERIERNANHNIGECANEESDKFFGEIEQCSDEAFNGVIDSYNDLPESEFLSDKIGASEKKSMLSAKVVKGRRYFSYLCLLIHFNSILTFFFFPFFFYLRAFHRT